jgi:hypothetical protein
MGVDLLTYHKGKFHDKPHIPFRSAEKKMLFTSDEAQKN